MKIIVDVVDFIFDKKQVFRVSRILSCPTKMTDPNNITEQPESRWRLRFNNFELAYFTFCRLMKRYETNSDDEVVLIAIVQAFEFTYEIAWILMRDYLKEEGFGETNGSKQTLRVAWQAGLIKDIDKWMDAVKNRNLTSHTYSESILQESVDYIVNIFFPIVQELFNDLEGRL
ncbi:MAG: nucleotidyltransferase substrate binding protein [Planctomycetaceae bacterium]|nr:nucleotidyltransferase substrate binding protein [Planctomycetaceae bacterium]